MDPEIAGAMDEPVPLERMDEVEPLFGRLVAGLHQWLVDASR
jgi:hypothetical protein